MAATCTAHVQCTECDVLVPITMQTWSATSECDHLMLVVEPDYTDAWAHAWTHDAE